MKFKHVLGNIFRCKWDRNFT